MTAYSLNQHILKIGKQISTLVEPNVEWPADGINPDTYLEKFDELAIPIPARATYQYTRQHECIRLSSLQRTGNAMITPLISLVCVGAAYGLLGWHLSAYDVTWAMGSWFAAITLTILLFWGEQVTKRMFRLGPRGVVSMLILSGVVTMAVAASTLFGMIVLLLATQTLARLELQSAGLDRRWTLLLMVFLSISTFSCGWHAGDQYFPSSEYWLTSHLLPHL